MLKRLPGDVTLPAVGALMVSNGRELSGPDETGL